MLMAKQPPRTPNANETGTPRTPGSVESREATTNRPAQADKPRRSRAGGSANRAEAQAAAAAPEARGVDASQPENRSMSMASSPSEEDIRLRAYQRYLERGGGDGMDFEGWLEAGREHNRRQN